MKAKPLQGLLISAILILAGCMDGGTSSTANPDQTANLQVASADMQASSKSNDNRDESKPPSKDDDGNTGGGGGGTPPPAAQQAHIVTAFNDLGMHCVDKEFSVFSILPPFNVVNAQVILRGVNGKPRILDASQVDVKYSAVADASGSINTTSAPKTNFWTYAKQLYGVTLQPDVGLLGQKMPGTQNTPQPFNLYDGAKRWFSAKGIPITPKDDAGRVNPYPLMRVQAFDKASGKLLASGDAVLPVSDETDCQNCHATGKIAAREAGITWATDSDLEIQTKKNILILHDAEHATNLKASMPVLCASCHYSPALDLARQGPQGAQLRHKTFSHVMHNFHGKLQNPGGGALFPVNGTVEQTCYQCHPGRVTQCLRGAMADAGMTCNSCHGGMLAVGGEFVLASGGSLDGSNDGKPRRPWQDLPRCQSCHTGDALNHLGTDLILRQAYLSSDPAASPIRAVNNRFAENPNTLYRDSLGHGGVACEGCHGSTHAEWPNGVPKANDNVMPIQLQGHAGLISECTTCHGQGSLQLTTNGPHGMHNVNDPRWTEDHGDFYERNPAACQACHGRNLEGTVLSKAHKARAFRAEDRTVNVAKGTKISCTLCHGRPD